jgi:hypothetical protein
MAALLITMRIARPQRSQMRIGGASIKRRVRQVTVDAVLSH